MKAMKRQIFSIFISLVLCTPAVASSWYYVLVGNEDTQFFFDADTIDKSKDKTILVWIKTVKTTKSDDDGSWSTAIRWKLNCTKRTIQTLMWSTYDQDGKFIKSGMTPSAEEAVFPDSTGEGMLKIACEQTFPNDKSSKKYFKLENNDPILATKNYVEYQKTQVDLAPK